MRAQLYLSCWIIQFFSSLSVFAFIVQWQKWEIFNMRLKRRLLLWFRSSRVVTNECESHFTFLSSLKNIVFKLYGVDCTNEVEKNLLNWAKNVEF